MHLAFQSKNQNKVILLNVFLQKQARPKENHLSKKKEPKLVAGAKVLSKEAGLSTDGARD